jgi:hypothetical protein
MKRIANHIAALALAASLVALVGCAARFTAYDSAHGDNHRWDRNEDRAYRTYWRDEHSHDRYRGYQKSNADQQKDYWNWRHNHPDSDRH